MTHLSDHRPTSPHLSIYRFQLTSITSILHRITGVALYAGSALLVAWLWAAAYNTKCYQTIYEHMSAWYGQLLLLGWTIAFFYHLSNGIRHLVWDMGYGFTLKHAYRSGFFVFFLTALLTALSWWFALKPAIG